MRFFVACIPMFLTACDSADTGDTADTGADTADTDDTADTADSDLPGANGLAATGASSGGGRVRGARFEVNLVVGDPAAQHQLRGDQHEVSLGLGTVTRTTKP